ncbi:MAG TPA: gliding motility protein GldM [Lutibacter sp.]|nr:gliding motility protein GldM [Lutibacter sp.]
MAGGKLSARQKMINLMYLVFIAMLAMNMDKKVLSSFGYSMEKLNASNMKVGLANGKIIEGLSEKATEQPEKYKKKYYKSVEINALSNQYFTYLEGVKNELIKTIEDSSDYESMDSENQGDMYFFVKDQKLSPKGQEFLDQINKYKYDIIEKISDIADEDLIKQIEKRFDTSDEIAGGSKTKMIPYMNSRYERFPLITTLNNITQIQADVRTTESDVYNMMFSGALKSAANLNTYVGIVALDKTAYFSGEQVTGKIVMGKFDKTFTAKYASNVGGKMENGQVNLAFRAGSAGSHPIKGSFTFKQKDGEDIIVPFKSEYTVITEPSSAVISADKMNVVYRGLDNPISISVPGVGASNVKASAPGLRPSGKGKYILNPTAGSTVTINVNAKLSSGKTINTKMDFRIMDIPAPNGAVRKQIGRISMPKASLAKATVGVILPDFVFDLTLRTTSFSVKVPGQATVKVKGARMDAKAANAISKARRGDMVNIFDIKSALVGSAAGYRIKNASPVMIEIK